MIYRMTEEIICIIETLFVYIKEEYKNTILILLGRMSTIVFCISQLDTVPKDILKISPTTIQAEEDIIQNDTIPSNTISIYNLNILFQNICTTPYALLYHHPYSVYAIVDKLIDVLDYEHLTHTTIHKNLVNILRTKLVLGKEEVPSNIEEVAAIAQILLLFEFLHQNDTLSVITSPPRRRRKVQQ